MDKNFSPFLEKNYNVLKNVIEKLNKKYDYASVLASECEGKRITVSNKNVSVIDSPWQERGFVIRVFHNGLYSEYSFDNVKNEKEICKKVEESIDIKENLYKSIYVKEYKNVLYEEQEIAKTFSRMGAFEKLPLDQTINQCQKIIEDSMEENEYIISARCDVEYLKISKMFLSRKKDLKQVYAWATASYQCVVNRNDVTKINYGGKSDISMQDALSKLKKSISKINDDATKLLDATHVIPGEYECITSPEISGLIAHEAFGHGVEMDMFVKNRAMGQKYINEKVGTKYVEMHDGAIPYNDVSSYFFDDEGTLAQDTTIIKDGTLKTGIADAISAAKLNIKPTGNGKRESFTRKAYTRMTNTYFSPKTHTLDEMIASIDYGYYIDVESSGMEDPKNWGIQCIAMIGKEIKNGKFTGKVVSPIIMTGNVLDLLNSITMVSNDFELLGNGSCGKGYKEWVKTSVGGPYMKVTVKLG